MAQGKLHHPSSLPYFLSSSVQLLIPWRFFRAWALLDGIDPPENMVRCMANNYSTFGFWRSWHRSYNLWVIRYIYIPLGGSRNVVLNTVLVFSFVALWHDLTFRLLMWGWLVSLFVIPELVASYVLPLSKVRCVSFSALLTLNLRVLFDSMINIRGTDMCAQSAACSTS